MTPMPRQMAAQKRMEKKIANLLRLEEKIAFEGGVIFLREPENRHHGKSTHVISAHLPWYDGQTACGKSTTDREIVRKPFPIKKLCWQCVVRVRRDEPAWYPTDEDLHGVIEITNSILAGG